MSGRGDVLELTASLPERRLATGEHLFERGDVGQADVAVLVEGTLRVELGGQPISDITIPGAFVGEIGALLGADRTATVVATTPATVRLIGDPEVFFADHPEVALELARQLAGRLQRLMAYLGDLRSQYADADGHLGVIDAVLGKIAARPAVDVEPGSERDGGYDG